MRQGFPHSTKSLFILQRYEQQVQGHSKTWALAVHIRWDDSDLYVDSWAMQGRTGHLDHCLLQPGALLLLALILLRFLLPR